MKLSEWARGQGVSYRAAWKWFHNGNLPVPARQLDTGTILVDSSEDPAGQTVAYCRVSSSDQREDLERQAGRVATQAGQRGYVLTRTVTEVGSGMSGHRPKLTRLLRDANVSTIVVEHRDRLARFGVEHLQAALAAHGRQIVILDDGETSDDLVRDVTEVLTSLCVRLYGRRSARKRAHAALDAAERGGADG